MEDDRTLTDSAVSESAPSDSTDLIRLAYAMTVEPHLHHVLAEAIDSEMARRYKEPSNLPDNMFSNVEIHFQNALELLEKNGRKTNTSRGAVRSVDQDPLPSALIDTDLRIVRTNAAGRAAHGWLEGKRINAQTFVNEESSVLRSRLAELETHDVEKPICVFGLYGQDETDIHRYVLMKSIDADNQIMGRISVVNLTWLPNIAYQFQESFNLTPIELKLTQAVVTGLSLRTLAKERRRSIGTLRNQLKHLLAKLNIHSQTELACLYSGFFQLTYNGKNGEYEHTFRNAPWRRQNLFETVGGHKIDYSEVGPKSGRPVLFFPSLIFGNAMSEAVRTEITKRRIRMIMPWRPGCGSSSLSGPVKGEPERFGTQLIQLLDYLKIDKVQILTESTGIISGAATMALLGDRAISLLGISSVVPLDNKKYFSGMSPPQRSLYYIARHAPALLPHLIRTIVAKCDSGYDEEWIIDHLKDSPIDLELFNSPEIKAAAREAFAFNYMHSTEGVVREFIQTGKKWGAVYENITAPITFATGEKTGQFNVDVLRDFTKNMQNANVVSLKGAALFAHHQQAKDVYDILDQQYKNAEK